MGGYDSGEDKNKKLCHRMYEKVVGVMSRVLENRPHEEVATRANISGPLENPKVSTLQVIVKLVQNAFFKAILPGFERETARLGRQPILLEGFMVGMAGAAAVAAWFLVVDVASGAPFRTPALLGAALFHGLRDAGALVITPGLVGAYTVVHCALFVLFGWATAGLFTLADRDRHVLFGLLMLFMCFEVAAFAFVAVLGSWLLHTITPGAIIGANLIATVVMLFLLYRNHRRAPGEVLTSAE